MAAPDSQPPVPQKSPQQPPTQHQPQPQPPLAQQLHPEIRSVIQLNNSHAHKVYFSGPLIRKIEHNPDGQKPIKDEGWNDIWAQLGGTTLSVWDMKEIETASKQGREVPPSYINVTDASVAILGAVTVRATPTTESKRFPNVLTINTAGSNLFLLSCQSIPSLTSWVAALRLASWEKSRLDEIYTAHLIRITLTARDIPTTLIKGKMEGWARIRIAGQTDWKKLWLVVQAGSSDSANDQQDTAAATVPNGNPSTVIKKKRVSNIFSSSSPPSSPLPTLPPNPLITMYASPKPKDKKKAPLLTISNAFQAFAVYPERPEMISKSTLIKVEGTFDESEMAGSWKGREGWVLIMPEGEFVDKQNQAGNPGGGQVAEMLKWIVSIHDAFRMYGRPQAWTWDPRDPMSLMYGYPVGPMKDNLFLDREIAEKMDPREDRTSFYRAELKKLLQQHMKHPVQVVNPQNRGQTGAMSGSGSSLDLSNATMNNGTIMFPPNQPSSSSSSPVKVGPQLPPLPFGSGVPVPFPSQSANNNNVNTNIQNTSTSNITPSKLSTIEESGVVAQSIQQQRQAIQSPSGIGRSDASLLASPTLPPNDSNVDGGTAPATPSKVPGTPPRQQLYGSASPPPRQTMAIPPRFKSSSQTSLGSANPDTRVSPIGSVSSNFGSSTQVGPRIAGSSVGTDQQSGALATGQPNGSRDRPQLTSAASNKNNNATLNKVPTPWSPTVETSRPQLSTSSSVGTTTTADTALTSIPSTSEELDAEESNALLKEPGVMFILGDQSPIRKIEAGMAGVGVPVLGVLNGDGEPISPLSSFGAIAAPSPQIPYAGIAESEDGHQQQIGKEKSQRDAPVRKGTPMSFVGPTIPAKATETTTPFNATSLAPTNGTSEKISAARFGSTLGRKPSGARELGVPRHSPSPQPHRSGASATNSSPRVALDNLSTSSRTFTEDDSVMEATVGLASKVILGVSTPGTGESLGDGVVGEEALAALTYLTFADGGERSGTQKTGTTPSTFQVPPPPPPLETIPTPVEPLKTRHTILASSGVGGGPSENDLPYTESSFTPSNKASERKAKAKAHKDAQFAAVHRPGRVNGKKKSMAGAWESSEDEEDEEEEEEDDDVDSDGEKLALKGMGAPRSASSSALGHGRVGSQMQPAHGGESAELLTPSQFRPPRNLPQIPGRLSPGEENTLSRRIPSEQYMDGARRTYYDEGPQMKTQAEAPAPGSQRQTIWTKVLDPNQQVRPQSEHIGKDTFVQLEPTETMTKAFALHGLLSAGIQDKEDRSAKRQEELARESGASLINVPNKPPPPQSGLLGYVTAHERERKREGGLGAALTEREREKRIAEERQRRLDEQQRHQLDQMQQGMMFNPMMNPMMNMMGMNPMMTGAGMTPMLTGGGMNPMMTGGGMGGINPMMTGMNPMMTGFGGMMGGFNPQHMFAAQQAAQAYQQAMMAFSVAGSQIGGPTAGGNNGTENAQPPSQMGNNTGMNSMMNPAMMGGFDPRMSMFGMMGMGMGGGLGPQMTGMSNFDSMASPGPGFGNGSGGMGANASPNAGSGGLGLQPPTMQRSQLSSRANSPARRDSPKVSGPSPANATNGEYRQYDRSPSRPSSPR